MKAMTARIITENINKNHNPYTVEEVEMLIKDSAERGKSELYLYKTNDKYINQKLIDDLVSDGYRVFRLQLSKILRIRW